MVVLKALRTSWRRTKDSKYRLLLQGLLLSRGRRSGAAARAKWNQETYLFCWFRMGETLVTEKAMAPHSSTLAWEITWTEEPGRLQSMGSRRVRHNWVTSLSLFTFMHWRRKWQPTPVFLPGKSHGQRSLVGCSPWGHTESDTTEATWLWRIMIYDLFSVLFNLVY